MHLLSRIIRELRSRRLVTGLLLVALLQTTSLASNQQAETMHTRTGTAELTTSTQVAQDMQDDDKKKKRKKKSGKKSTVKNPQPVPDFTVPEKIDGEAYVYFAAIGDQGTGDAGQHFVAHLMNEKAKKDSLQFVLTLGDNIYSDGVRSIRDPQWREKFVDVYNLSDLNIPFYASLGNHDHHKRRAPHQVAYSKVSEKWHMPAQFYTFTKAIDDEHSIQFFALDTTPWVDNKDYVDQVIWLEEALRTSRARWKVVFGHHPIFSYGKHGHEKKLIKELRPLLEEYDVDLYLNGHDHDRQILEPIEGVYYVTSGTGAKSRDAVYGPLTKFTETNLGFAYFRVSKTEMHLQFINGEGEIEFAHTWKKGEADEMSYRPADVRNKRLRSGAKRRHE